MALSMIAFLAGCLSLTTGILVFLISLNLLRHFFKNRNIAGLYLTLSVFAWVGMTASVTFIYWASESSGLGIGGLEIAVIFQKLVYISVCIAMIFMYMFASKILFNPKKVFTILYIIAGIVVMVFLSITDSISYSDRFPDADYPLLTLKTEYSIGLIAFVLPTILSILIISIRLVKKMEDPIQKVRFKVIAAGQLMIMISFIVDTLATLFLDIPMVYAFFLYMTWVFILIAAILYDTGWRLPSWLVKKYKSSE